MSKPADISPMPTRRRMLAATAGLPLLPIGAAAVPRASLLKHRQLGEALFDGSAEHCAILLSDLERRLLAEGRRPARS